MRILASFAGLASACLMVGCAPIVSLSLSATHTAWNIAAEVPRAALSCVPWSTSYVEKPDSPSLPGSIEPKRGRLFPVPVAPVFAPAPVWRLPQENLTEPIAPPTEANDAPAEPVTESIAPTRSNATADLPTARAASSGGELGMAGLPWEDSPREVVRTHASGWSY